MKVISQAHISDKKLELADKIFHGDLEICITSGDDYYEDDTYFYLTRETAKEVIEHIITVFDLKEDEYL